MERKYPPIWHEMPSDLRDLYHLYWQADEEPRPPYNTVEEDMHNFIVWLYGDRAEWNLKEESLIFLQKHVETTKTQAIMNKFIYPHTLSKDSDFYQKSYVVEHYQESTYFNHHKPLVTFKLYEYFYRMPVYIVRKNWKHYCDWDKAEIVFQKDLEELKDWMEVRTFEVRSDEFRHYFCIMSGGDFD